MTEETNPHLLFRELERGIQRHRRPSLRPEYHCPHCGGNDTQSLAEAINDNRREWTFETPRGTRAGRFIRADLASKDPGLKPLDPLSEFPWIFLALVAVPPLIMVIVGGRGILLVASLFPGLAVFTAGVFRHLQFPMLLSKWELKAWKRDTDWRCRQCGEEWDPADRVPAPLPEPSGGIPTTKISTAELPPNGAWIETYKKAE